MVERVFNSHLKLLMVMSFCVASLLAVLPLPESLLWLRPPWLLLVLLCWLLAFPYRTGLALAWLVGLFADLLYGVLLGVHACVFLILAYCVLRFHGRINAFPLRQQALIVFFLLLLHQLLLFWFYALLGEAPTTLYYWLSSFSGGLMWPLLYSLLGEFTSPGEMGTL